MRIGFISSYPPIECGVGTYTQYLTDALRKRHADIYIVSHLGGSGKQVFPAFDYDDPDLADRAFSVMLRFTPDVVHIQHEFGLFGRNFGVAVVPLILNFRLLEIPVVTTLHTVYENINPQHRIILNAILSNSNRVIVHEEYQKRVLEETFRVNGDEIIRVIPHGAREVEPIPNAKQKLGLPEDKKIILMIGYFRPSKNFELIVNLFPRIVQQYPNTVLVIAGKTRGKEFIEYRNQLFDQINRSPVKDRIYIIRGQLPQDTFDTIISAADMVVLPYKINSQSGILAHSLAFGKPVITSNSSSMVQTLERSNAGLICHKPDDFVENIVKLLKDPQLAGALSEGARRYVQENIGWSLIAEKHLGIYRDIIRTPEINSRTIWVD